MHVGEMVTVLVGQARREGQQEVTCSIQLSAQLSLGRCWAKPTASPLLLPGSRQEVEGSEEGRACSCEAESPAAAGPAAGSSFYCLSHCRRLSFSRGGCNMAIGTSRVPFWIPGLSNTTAGGMAWREHMGWEEKEGD